MADNDRRSLVISIVLVTTFVCCLLWIRTQPWRADTAGRAVPGVAAAGPTVPEPRPRSRRTGQFTPEELGVWLDPAGRPYDASRLSPGTSHWAEDLGEFEAIDGRLTVMSGEELGIHPEAALNQVDLGSSGLRLTLLHETVTTPEGRFSGILGVRFDVPGTAVETWRPFETAYATDAGMGGVTSYRAVQAGWIPDEALDLPIGGSYVLASKFGTPVPDSLIFGNGFGDGGFPMSRGVDHTGKVVSLVIWRAEYPWRLAVPDGTPPPDITRREQQISDCLHGRRPVNQNNWCMGDDD